MEHLHYEETHNSSTQIKHKEARGKFISDDLQRIGAELEKKPSTVNQQ